MKIQSFTLLACCVFACCERQNTGSSLDPREVASAPSKKKSPISTQNVEQKRLWPVEKDLETKAIALVLTRTQTDRVRDDALAELESLAPQLIEAGILAERLGAVPNEQLPVFRTHLFNALKSLAPQPGKNFDSKKYEATVRLTRELHTTELATLVFEHLKAVPPYIWPEASAPKAWASVELARNAARGTQGLIATTVVEYGDVQTMQSYRNELLSAPPELQRLMIWALGKSPELADFELLWTLRSQVSGNWSDTLQRALNAIPNSMERVARFPEGGQVNREGLDSSTLEATAAACRLRLKEAEIVVSLTAED